MKFQGALIEEQGVTFAIIAVKEDVLNDVASAEEFIDKSKHLFPDVPLILVSQDPTGSPKFCGRSDIVDFMVCVPFEDIPWQEFTIQ